MNRRMHCCLTSGRSGRARSVFSASTSIDDLDALGALLKRDRFSHVVNFAAQSMVGQSWDHPDDWMMTNVVSTVRLHVLLRDLDFLDRYVHVTTPEVYGSTDGWVRENTPFNPSTPYAVSRAAGDMSLKTFVDTYKLPAVSTRAANVYGPGQQLYRIIPRTIYAAMTGQKLKLDGGGVSERVFVHMRDVSDATLKIALKGTLGETYHISGYELVSIRKLVEIILGKLGRKFDDCVELGPERPGKDAAYMLESLKLRTELGWKDEISLEAGVDSVIAWAKRFEKELSSPPVPLYSQAMNQINTNQINAMTRPAKTPDVAFLKRKAAELRGEVIGMSHKAGSAHLASCLSCIDVLTAAYWHVLNIDPAKPTSEARDRFILSKGHAAMAIYATLAHRGFFSRDLLETYTKDGGKLAEHPPANLLPGIEAATGSLGHGLPIANGHALAARIKGKGASLSRVRADVGRRMQRRLGLGSGDVCLRAEAR